MLMYVMYSQDIKIIIITLTNHFLTFVKVEYFKFVKVIKHIDIYTYTIHIDKHL